MHRTPRGPLVWAMLLLALAVATPAAGMPLTCLATFGAVTASPGTVSAGDVLTLAAEVRDANPLPDPEGTNLVRVALQITYSDGTVEPTLVIGPFQAPGAAVRAFTVPASAPAGTARATFELLPPPPPPDLMAWLGWCSVHPDAPASVEFEVA